jgi:hypothetical protein
MTLPLYVTAKQLQDALLLYNITPEVYGPSAGMSRKGLGVLHSVPKAEIVCAGNHAVSLQPHKS